MNVFAVFFFQVSLPPLTQLEIICQQLSELSEEHSGPRERYLDPDLSTPVLQTCTLGRTGIESNVHTAITDKVKYCGKS